MRSHDEQVEKELAMAVRHVGGVAERRASPQKHEEHSNDTASH